MLCTVLRDLFNLKYPLLLSFFLVFFCTAVPQMAMAVNVPPSVQPGQIQQTLPEIQAPSGVFQLNSPAPDEPQDLPEDVRAKLAKNKFLLKAVVFEDMTVFDPKDLADTYEGFIGKTISLLDARTIAHRVTAFYRDAGYILSQAVVPEQKINDGVLKIRVVED